MNYESDMVAAVLGAIIIGIVPFLAIMIFFTGLFF